MACTTLRRCFVALVAPLLIAALAACGGSDGPKTPKPNMEVSGTVRGLTDQGQSSPLSGASIVIKNDRNGDGSISKGERYSAETDSDGAYSAKIAGEGGQRLVVSFAKSAYADRHETIEIGSASKIQVDAVLYSSETLECQGPECATQDRSLRIRGLPENVQGSGRVFNPVVQTDAFPGEFEDDRGNMLISGVFSIVELRDESGDELEKLDDPATLQMRFPRDTWSVIRDIESGNGVIDVPLYAFDEDVGEWKRDGRGTLVDSEGTEISENELSAIKSGSYSGVIYARGKVDHFSAWNVDWPVESHGCVTARVVDASGSVARGASISVYGLTYAGTSSTQTIGEDGTFCVDVMRSEKPNEDIDGNGANGDTHRIGIRAIHDGKFYDLGEHEVPTAQATCGEQGCLQLGEVELGPENELEPTMCTFDVEVVDAKDQPLQGASVFGSDPTLPGEVVHEMCLDPQTSEYECTPYASTDANGEAELEFPILDRPSIYAFASGVNPNAFSSVRTGSTSASGCPSETLTVRAEQGYDFFNLEVSVDGRKISWKPTIGAQAVLVSSAIGQPKWWVYSGDSKITSPVTYGTLPTGAEQSFPVDGIPAGLSSGDQVHVHSFRSTDEGVFEMHLGSTAVP